MSFFLDKIEIFIKNKNKRRLYIFKFLKLISIDVIFFLLSILILPAFVMFKKIINIRICEVQTQRIGHLLLNSELYLCKTQSTSLKFFSQFPFLLRSHLINKAFLKFFIFSILPVLKLSRIITLFFLLNNFSTK